MLRIAQFLLRSKLRIPARQFGAERSLAKSKGVPVQLELLESREVPTVGPDPDGILSPRPAIKSPPPTAFVQQLFQDLLGRQAEATDRNFFANRITSEGISRAQIAREIEQSPERRLVVVDSIFETVLGRSAEATGQAHWASYLAQGNSQQQLLVEVLISPESMQLYAPHFHGVALGVPDFSYNRINAVFQNLLGRIPFDSDYIAWDIFRQSDNLPFAAVNQVATSPEAYSNLVRTTYHDLLGRAPEDQGLTTWANSLASGNTVERMILALASSPEYYARAQDKFQLQSISTSNLGRT